MLGLDLLSRTESGGKGEVAVLLEPDFCRLAIYGHRRGELFEERDAEVGELDVLRQAEEPANTAGCERCRGELVTGIPFDNRHIHARLEQPEEVRDRCPDRASSDDEHVCLHAVVSSTSDQELGRSDLLAEAVEPEAVDWALRVTVEREVRRD